MSAPEVRHDAQSSRLESGLTLTPSDSMELNYLPDQGTRTSGGSGIPGDSTIKPLSLGGSSSPTPEPPSNCPGWKTRLNNTRATHPRLWRFYYWLGGPSPPANLQPSPLLDTTSLRWRDHTIHIGLLLESRWLRYTTTFRRGWLLVLLSAVYIIGLALISRSNSFLTPAESFITCTSTYWLKDDGCGLNGQSCSPFTGPDFEFRCPGNCLSVTLANPRAVGAEEVVYTSLVVGGGDNNRTYRGDSWICPAAIQAGVISASKGGCGTLRLVGNHSNFIPEIANGVSSIGFPSIFPVSFRFLDSSPRGNCADLRDYALAYNVICTSILLLLLQPAPIWIFWCLLCVGFWHITLFSDQRSSPPVLSDGFGTFLPALFVGYAFWRSAWRFTLPAFSGMPWERVIWYLPTFWAGVHFNVLTAKIPVDRLLGSDLQRPGATTALVVVVIIVVGLIINQIRLMRKSGMLFYYISCYIVAGIIVGVLASLPTLTFRLHHYIAAIVLMPLTAFPARISALCQAFLLGMFLQGVAKFGFDSILQTAAELRRDAPLGSSLPTFVNPSTIITNFTNTSVTWSSIPAELSESEGWNGYSLLVDDVQRLAGESLSYSLAGLETGMTHFFRLAYQRDGTSGDYTKAATLLSNGTWLEPLPGPS